MLRKCLAVVSENGPAGHVRADCDVPVLSHRGEPPYGESMTKQIDVVNGLNSPSARAQPHVGREQRSTQGGDDGRSQHDVAEVMVLRAEVSARDIGPVFVIPNRRVKEVQTDAVGAVRTTHLSVEVIVRAPIVLVDVSVLDKHPLGGVRKLGFETLGNALGIELRVQDFNQAIVPFRRIEIDPIVGGQCPYSQLVLSSALGCRSCVPKSITDPGTNSFDRVPVDYERRGINATSQLPSSRGKTLRPSPLATGAL